MKNLLKKQAVDKIDEFSDELIGISQRIWQNPETKFKEHGAVKLITGALKDWGCNVEVGIEGLETAFRAVYVGRSHGPTVALLSEYDALSHIGHACGHNLIAGAGLGAFISFQSIKREIPGTVILLGTPAEEGGGGKVMMIERGLFKNCDAALMVHPASFNNINPITLSLYEISIAFKGKAAHAAASPEDGINALDGVIQTFNGINALKEHIRDDSRIHGIITNGGVSHNVVPELAEALFAVRAKDSRYCKELVEKLKRCAEGAALASGAKLEIKQLGHRQSLKPNQHLSSAFLNNAKLLKERIIEDKSEVFSTDMGNVSHVTPSIHPMFAICDEKIPLHSRDFAKAANSERAYREMIIAAKTMAMTAIDFITDNQLRINVKDEFKSKPLS